MTEKDLLQALRHVDKKYTDEAKARAEAAAEKKPRGIMMRTAAAAVGAAACFGLILFGLAFRQDPEITVADSDTADQLTYAYQTEASAAARTAVTAETTQTTALKLVTEMSGTSKNAAGTQRTDASAVVQTEASAAQKTTAFPPDSTTAAAARSTTAASAITPVTSPTDSGMLTYSLIPSAKSDWLSAEEYGLANNVYRGVPGERLDIDVVVKRDPGISAFNMMFEGSLTWFDLEQGDAYDFSLAEFNLYETNGKGILNYIRSTNSIAPDDSTVCVYSVRVPSNPGRYTVSMNGDFVSIQPDGSDLPLDYVCYGLDILVGDEPVPEQAEPQIYDSNISTVFGSPVYDNPRDAFSNLAFQAEPVTAHAGEKNVPVHLRVSNSGSGFVSGRVKLNIAPELRVQTEDSVPVVSVSQSFDTFTCSGVLDEEKNIVTLSFGENSNTDRSVTGVFLTVYVDIPEDAEPNTVYKVRTSVEALQDAKSRFGDVSLTVRSVNGMVTVLDDSF